MQSAASKVQVLECPSLQVPPTSPATDFVSNFNFLAHGHGGSNACQYRGWFPWRSLLYDFCREQRTQEAGSLFDHLALDSGPECFGKVESLVLQRHDADFALRVVNRL